MRWLDASATARTGVPYVKIFREERDRSLLLALDASGSMGFGTAGAAKAATAAHALALLASAAGRAGDRIGLVVFDAGVRAEVGLGRGRAQSARVIRIATQQAAQSRGPTDLAAALRALRRRTARRAVIVLISDFRDPALRGGDAGPLRRELAALARGNDVVAAAVVDPREQALVAAGGVRVRDAERGGRTLRALDGERARAPGLRRGGRALARTARARPAERRGRVPLAAQRPQPPLRARALLPGARGAPAGRRAMTRRSACAAALLSATLLASACRQPPPGAPVEPRAAWLLDPPQVRIGDVAMLERLVVTPPGWTVVPFQPAQAPAGFWLLDAEALPPERLASRWLHRTRLRIRARELGRFEWPAATAEVEAPDGVKMRLALDAQPLEVVSLLSETPDRLTPFGVRPLPETPARSLLAAAAAGAFGTLAALSVFLLVARRRRARAVRPREPAAGEPPETRARAALGRARAALEADPRAAADAAATVLRRFLSERFGVPAPARTSQELAAMTPPFALTTRWAGVVALLRSLDEQRFAPPPKPPGGAGRLAPLLDAAELFIAQTLPPAAPR